MKPMMKEKYMPGDVVEYKGSNRIVLTQMTMQTGTEICHVYHPEKGVFSAYPDELKYVAHLTEMDIMLERLDKVTSDKKSA